MTAADTALAVGSGDVDVLATPRLIAWMEALTVRGTAPLLVAGQTSVGTAVRVTHQRPSRVGDAVEITADPPVVEGRRLLFRVRALNSIGQTVAEGELERAIVDRNRFLDR
ncbi:MAG TPA: hotdog domain-containing protein [Kribbella sp.]|nr:hotdog domain-containing protein [Kribbella sp.]